MRRNVGLQQKDACSKWDTEWVCRCFRRPTELDRSTVSKASVIQPGGNHARSISLTCTCAALQEHLVCCSREDIAWSSEGTRPRTTVAELHEEVPAMQATEWQQCFCGSLGLTTLRTLQVIIWTMLEAKDKERQCGNGVDFDELALS